MGKWISLLLGAMLIIVVASCDDDTQDVSEVVGVDEPIDDLVRLENITISNTPAGAATNTVDITYDTDQLIADITFTGDGNKTFQFSYAVNNRLTQIEQTIASQTTSSTLAYENNTITVRIINPDGSQQEKELRIDSQNRIDRSITYNLDNAGNRTETERLQYQYTDNFNVIRIDDLASNGNSVLGYTEFTYFFNNNPFRDMNDVIRFLVFEDFIPYTRYLPSTQIDFERVGGTFVQTTSISYNYTLQDDQFPSSREVDTTTAAGTQTTFESFNYQE